MPETPSKKLEIRFHDRPELSETFADSIGGWHFDGGALRIDFLVTRFDDQSSAEVRTGHRFPACRLVLSATGTAELINECRRIAATLEKAGVFKKQNPEAPKQTN